MRLSDNKKFIAARIRDLSKLILKDRDVTPRFMRRFKNVLRITKRSARNTQSTIIWVLMNAYPPGKHLQTQYIDIEGYLTAAKKEDNWAYTSDLPSIAEIVAVDVGGDVNDY